MRTNNYSLSIFWVLSVYGSFAQCAWAVDMGRSGEDVSLEHRIGSSKRQQHGPLTAASLRKSDRHSLQPETSKTPLPMTDDSGGDKKDEDADWGSDEDMGC